MLYLTYRERNEDGSWQLAIPNRKIHDLFERQIKTWFFTHIEGGMEPLYKAFDSQNIEEIEKCINACMTDSIMFRESPPLKFAYGEGRAYVHDSLRESGQVMDGGNTDEAKETFYHGLLLGILRARRGWRVKSNREAGRGRADIILVDRVRQCGHIIEVKYVRSFQSLESRAQEGLQQIYDTGYDDYFSDWDFQTIYHYGIAFHQKKCKVVDTVQSATNS